MAVIHKYSHLWDEAYLACLPLGYSSQVELEIRYRLVDGEVEITATIVTDVMVFTERGEFCGWRFSPIERAQIVQQFWRETSESLIESYILAGVRR